MTSWIEIDEERLRGNFEVFRQAVREAGGDSAAILAVVKANAYGHGLERCACVLAQAGAEWLGVTGVEEGQRLRRVLSACGLSFDQQPHVLVMCGLSAEDAEAVVAERLTPVVWGVEQVQWLARVAGRRGDAGGLRVWIEFDSGMSRQGVRSEAGLREVVAAIGAAEGLRLEGLMTHFASAEVAGSAQTALQRLAFERAVDEVRRAGVVPGWLSVGNTSGVDLEDEAQSMAAWVEGLARSVGARGLVRTGLGLYGYALPLEGDGGSSRLAGSLQPVMTWKAGVIGVEDVPAGGAVGYNGTFVAQHAMRLALVAAGYADGLRRELSSTNTKPGGWVMLQGRRAPVVGRISMNLTTVDVTGMKDVKVGDEAVLLGEGITAQDHARLADTIAYEILCGVRAGERPGDRPG